MAKMQLVPSRDLPDGRAALRRMLVGAKWLHGAVAFVTQSGVDLLGELVDEAGLPPDGVRLVARGAPITEPQALLSFAERFEAEIRVVTGPDALIFHPKLWISRTGRETWVLSGSGNLTAGGLTTNAEQFELLRFPHAEATVSAPARPDPLVHEHSQRMHRFQEQGRPVRDLIGSPAWTTWLAQLDARAELRRQQQALDAELVAQRVDANTDPGQGELALSRSTDALTIRRWVRKWYPRTADQELVWTLLADTIEACHANRPNGWVACAVHYGRDKHARISILAGVAQVFVVHSRFGVFFESPPPGVSPQIAEPLDRVLAMPGVDRDDWGEPVPHPCVKVPAAQLQAAAADGMGLVQASIDWRIPPDPAAGTGHASNHCLALVEELARRTGRSLPQPDYEPLTGSTWAGR